MADIVKGGFWEHSLKGYIFIKASKDLNPQSHSFCEQTFHGAAAPWKLIKYWTSELIKYRISLAQTTTERIFTPQYFGLWDKNWYLQLWEKK